MSIGSFDSALNFSGPSGFDITLKLSYVPLANTVGVTPEGGDAIAMVPNANQQCHRRDRGTCQ